MKEDKGQHIKSLRRISCRLPLKVDYAQLIFFFNFDGFPALEKVGCLLEKLDQSWFPYKAIVEMYSVQTCDTPFLCILNRLISQFPVDRARTKPSVI